MIADPALIIAFVNGGHPVPLSQHHLKVLSDFFDVIQECIVVGAEKLGLVHSKIINGEFWLKQENAGYKVINPHPDVQTVVSADEDMQKLPADIGIYDDQLVGITDHLKELLKKVNDSKE